MLEDIKKIGQEKMEITMPIWVGVVIIVISVGVHVG
jgi:hypothetical protein